MTSIMTVIGAKGTKRPHSGKEGYHQKKKKRRAAPQTSSSCATKRSSNSNWDEEEPPRKKAAYSQLGEISAPLTKSQLSIGTSLSLNDFIFYRELGEGSYGKVMLARWSINSKWVAVKAIKKRVLLEEDKDSTLVERRVMEAAGDCPFLTQMYAAFQTQDNIFFVMEYLSQGDLFQLLQETGPLDPETTKFYAAEIAYGIKYLHNRGIIHRDLKPENILLDSDGHAKIGDFGLALDTKTCGQKATGYAGTEGYIAPEIQNGKSYNTTVDWYSFGVILYNMVTGKFPAQSPSSQKLRFPSSVSSHTKDLIRKLLVKDPVRRQQIADTIFSHPFFCNVNWEDLQQGRIQPPFPKLMEKNKFYVAEESPFSSTDALEPRIASENQQLFRGFSFLGSDL